MGGSDLGESVAGLVKLKAGRERPLRQRHPWVFSGAVQAIDAAVGDVDLAEVVSGEDEFLARGYVNRRSQIVVRLVS